MGRLTFVDTGTTIEVPDNPDEERAVVAAHPEYQQAMEASRQRVARGDPGIPLEDIMAQYGIEPTPRRRPTGIRPTGASGNVRVRMPKKLHKELTDQAAREGVSLNTLIVTYLAREAGVQAARHEA